MFEKFTNLAKRSITLSQDEAITLGHDYIGTEHMLLGILHADDDTGQRLAGLGLTADRAERALADLFARIQADRRNAG